MEEPYLKKFKEKAVGRVLTPDFTLEQITGKTKVPEGQVFVLGIIVKFLRMVACLALFQKMKLSEKDKLFSGRWNK